MAGESFRQFSLSSAIGSCLEDLGWESQALQCRGPELSFDVCVCQKCKLFSGSGAGEGALKSCGVYHEFTEFWFQKGLQRVVESYTTPLWDGKCTQEESSKEEPEEKVE